MATIESTTPMARIWVAETSKHAIWMKMYASATHPGISQAKGLYKNNIYN